MNIPMTGWKTKWGASLFAIGFALVGAAKLAPSVEVTQWTEFIGQILEGVGGALATIGVGHKIEKAGPTTTNVINVSSEEEK